MTDAEKDWVLTRYWLDHYVENGLCALCGNTGTLMVEGSETPRGGYVQSKTVNCFCPNGRKIQEKK